MPPCARTKPQRQHFVYINKKKAEIFLRHCRLVLPRAAAISFHPIFFPIMLLKELLYVVTSKHSACHFFFLLQDLLYVHIRQAFSRRTKRTWCCCGDNGDIVLAALPLQRRAAAGEAAITPALQRLGQSRALLAARHRRPAWLLQPLPRPGDGGLGVDGSAVQVDPLTCRDRVVWHRYQLQGMARLCGRAR